MLLKDRIKKQRSVGHSPIFGMVAQPLVGEEHIGIQHFHLVLGQDPPAFRAGRKSERKGKQHQCDSCSPLRHNLSQLRSEILLEGCE